jgi:hypothetical protein
VVLVSTRRITEVAPTTRSFLRYLSSILEIAPAGPCHPMSSAATPVQGRLQTDGRT